MEVCNPDMPQSSHFVSSTSQSILTIVSHHVLSLLCSVCRMPAENINPVKLSTTSAISQCPPKLIGYRLSKPIIAGLKNLNATNEALKTPFISKCQAAIPFGLWYTPGLDLKTLVQNFSCEGNQSFQYLDHASRQKFIACWTMRFSYTFHWISNIIIPLYLNISISLIWVPFSFLALFDIISPDSLSPIANPYNTTIIYITSLLTLLNLILYPLLSLLTMRFWIYVGVKYASTFTIMMFFSQ